MKSFIESVQMRFKSIYLKNIDLIVKNRKQLKKRKWEQNKGIFGIKTDS